MSIFTTAGEPVLVVRVDESAPHTSVVTAAGEVDSDSCTELRRAIAGEVGRRRRVVLDLRAVTFLDAAGIRTLLVCRQQAEANGNRLEIRATHPDVHQVLQICGVRELFEPTA